MTNIKRFISNMRDGYHHNSAYWQNIRKQLPALPPILMEIAIAMVLSDAGLARTSIDAHMKIEQGWKQKAFVYHLFDLFKKYCFAEAPKAYIPGEGHKDYPQLKGEPKSYWFKTFSHSSFTFIWNLFYDANGVRTIQPGLILNHINALGLAYWIMSDGSLQNDGKTMIIHSQCFTKEENECLSKELNQKFGLHTKVISPPFGKRRNTEWSKYPAQMP